MLIWRLLPYGLVAGALIVIAGASRTLSRGEEGAPTSVALADVSAVAPDRDWLTITGGGLYLPDSVQDTKTSKRSAASKTTAYYVPIVTPAEAEALADGGSLGSGKRVFVKVKPDVFDARFPDKPETDAFQPIDVRGSRASSMPQRLEDYLKTTYGLSKSQVTLLDFEGRPMSMAMAIGLTLASIGIAVGAILWIKHRWRRPQPPPLPPAFEPAAT